MKHLLSCQQSFGHLVCGVKLSLVVFTFSMESNRRSFPARSEWQNIGSNRLAMPILSKPTGVGGSHQFVPGPGQAIWFVDAADWPDKAEWV